MFSAGFPLNPLTGRFLGLHPTQLSTLWAFRDHFTIDDVGPPWLFLGSDAGTTRCAVGDLLQGWPIRDRTGSAWLKFVWQAQCRWLTFPLGCGVFFYVSPGLTFIFFFFKLTPQMLKSGVISRGKAFFSLPVILRPLEMGLNQKMSGLPGRFSDVPAIHRLRSCQIAWLLWVWWRKKWCTSKMRRAGRNLESENRLQLFKDGFICFSFGMGPSPVEPTF